MSSPSNSIPTEFVDSHHHFVDSSQEFCTFLHSFAPDLLYTPEQYEKDVVEELKTNAEVTVTGSVHIEAMPDDGASEAAWIEQMITADKCHTVKAIVGSVNLAAETAKDEIDALMKSSNKVRGVRWMLDCVGPFEDGKTATHIATKRHDGVDYLRGDKGGYDGDAVPAFEKGYAMLAENKLSFDLQCAPAQLEKAAELASRHPDIPVVIDHLGKPRLVLGADLSADTPDETELQTWRTGMKAMAKLQHVYVKISMLGYITPGWIESEKGEKVLKELVLETVQLFTPSKCMVATNWWANASASDSDFISDKAPSPSQLLYKISTWLSEAGYSKTDLERMFSGTAKEFYRIS